MKHSYTVTWWKSVERELTTAWLQAGDRRKFTRLVDELEQELATAPEKVGEHYREGLRRAFVDDWLVYFTISEADCMVEVVMFRRNS